MKLKPPPKLLTNKRKRKNMKQEKRKKEMSIFFYCVVDIVMSQIFKSRKPGPERKRSQNRDPRNYQVSK
jgi:hypothetical protein